MKRILPVAILVLLFSHANAQQDISPGQRLRLARSIYEQGRLNEVVTQLNETFFREANKAEKVEGYKILCLTYIYLEEPEKADEAMLNILITDPYFQINPAVDPAEFVALYSTFRTNAIYRIGAKLGINASEPNVKESVTAVELAPGSEYKYMIGLTFGASADIPINKKLTLHGEVMFVQRKFELNMTVNRGSDVNGDPLKNKFSGIESQSWIALPITVEYLIADKKYLPYVSGGVAFDYLLGSSISAERQRDNQQSIEQKKYEFKPYRENLNVSIVLAAGSKLKLAGGYFVAEVRYQYGLTKVSSKATAYANTEFTLDQGYADPVFSISALSLTGSYVYNIFKPKKLTRKK